MFWFASTSPDPRVQEAWIVAVREAISNTKWTIRARREPFLAGGIAMQTCHNENFEPSSFGRGFIIDSLDNAIDFGDHLSEDAVLSIQTALREDACQVSGHFATVFSHEGKIYLINDFYSVQPLYFSLSGSTLVASSDLRALLAYPGLRIEPDPDFIRYSTNPKQALSDSEYVGQTPYFGVSRIPPGSVAIFHPSRAEIDLIDISTPVICPPRFEGSFGDAVLELERRLERVVRGCYAGSAKINLFDLSGGIDSATICAAGLRSEGARGMQTISLVPKGTSHYLDDTDLISNFNKRHKISNSSIYIEDTLEEESSIIPFLGPRKLANYNYFRLAQQRAQELGARYHLTGEGADYHFLGTDLLQDNLPSLLNLGCVSGGRRLAKIAFDLALSLVQLVPMGHRYIYKKALWPELIAADLGHFIRSDAGRAIKDNKNATAEKVPAARRHLSQWYKMFHFDMLYPRASYTDEFSHFPALTVAPYLDASLISLSFSLPPDFFIDRETFEAHDYYSGSKRLLRNSFQDTIPDEISKKKKKTSYNHMAGLQLQARGYSILTELKQAFKEFPELGEDINVNLVLTCTERLCALSRFPTSTYAVDFKYIMSLVALTRWRRSLEMPKHDFLKASFYTHRAA